MNNFAKIKHITSFKKVEYYSVCLEDDSDISLFELFIQKHAVVNREKFQHIMAWIKVIGEKYGAKEFYFRNEAEIADTGALPPQGINKEPCYIEMNDATGELENTANNLRLYCFRANDKVVFLFNGDIKTTQKAQDCKNVRPHFKLANAITKALENSFGNEIRWNADYTDIEFIDSFELNW